MSSADGGLGKKHEELVKAWLDRPEEGYSFDRIPDQVSGFFGSSNICDFICFKYPDMYYIECKATWSNRFDFSMISEKQHEGLINKSRIQHVHGWVIVLFASYKRAFVIDINEIDRIKQLGRKSINIDKLLSGKLDISYSEIETIPNFRKKYLNYCGELEDHLRCERIN